MDNKFTDPIDSFIDAEVMDPEEAAMERIKEVQQQVNQEQFRKKHNMTTRVYDLCSQYNQLTDEEELQFLRFLSKHRKDIIVKAMGNE